MRAPTGISAPRLYLPASETDFGLWYLMVMAGSPIPIGKEAHGFRSEAHGVKHQARCISWAAASPAARRPGSSRAPACRWCCTRCGRCAAPRRTRPTALAELVCSNSFRSDDAANNAVGLLHEEMRRAGSLIMRAADAHKLPAGGALAVDRHGFSAARPAGAARPSAGRTAARGDRRPAARRLGQRDRGDRPPHLAGARRRDRAS